MVGRMVGWLNEKRIKKIEIWIRKYENQRHIFKEQVTQSTVEKPGMLINRQTQNQTYRQTQQA